MCYVLAGKSEVTKAGFGMVSFDKSLVSCATLTKLNQLVTQSEGD